MSVRLSSGYNIRVARDCTMDAYTFGNIIITGSDGHTSQDILTLSPKEAIELAREILGAVTLGMDD